MARQSATSIGGKSLASKVYSFIQANKEVMKSSSDGRKAEENEIIGDEDLANAIAYAVQEALVDQTVLVDAKVGVAGNFIVPPAILTPVTVLPAFPLNLPTASVKNLIYKS